MNTKKGFTFIELLISVTIFSWVAAGVYTVFAYGINIWRRGNESGRYEQNVRLVLEKMAKELRNSFKFSNIPFEGTEASIMFPSLIHTVSEDISQFQAGKSVYFFDKEKNEFCREQKMYFEVFQEEEIENDVRKLISGVMKLNFNYCYLDNATGGYKWKDDWKEEEQDTYPRAVKIELVLETDSKKQIEFEKIVFMPIGTGEQKIELNSSS